jgi:gamma-glutamyltranspeptidase/glutathione hydrolase
MKGVVAAGDRLTAKAGGEALRKGGNAYDAVTASIFAGYMAEPCLTSPAGGGLLLSYNRQEGSSFYDFFVDTPPIKGTTDKDFYPIEVDFGSAKQMFHIGHASIAIPGVVKGLLSIHEERGLLPLSEVLRPAITYAKKGVYLSESQSYVLKILEPIYKSTEESRKIFTKDGNILGVNDRLVNKDYANFLEMIVEEGESIFYTGKVANNLCQVCAGKNGLITEESLRKYKVNKTVPIKFRVKNYEIITSPVPSLGGFLIKFTMLLVSSMLNKFKWGSKEHIVGLIKALKLTQEFRENELLEFISPDNKLIKPLNISTMIKYQKLYKKYLSKVGNTTHISIIDEIGNAVSCTTSNGEGSGVIIPETGIMTNNMLGEADLNPNGFFKWPAYTRLPSMMSPTIVLKNKEPYMVLGSSGSNRIRSAIVQTLMNVLFYEQNVDLAVNNPRIHFEDNCLYIEPGFSDDLLAYLESQYNIVKFRDKNLYFGGVHAVTGTMEGAADVRRQGSVEVVK